MHILQGEALDRRMDEVLDFVGAFFVNKSSVHLAAEDLARRLQESGIEYAIAGGLSLGVHGRGYVNLRAGGKPVRDTAHNVRIDFLIAGDFPGDGQPKPVATPEPASASIVGEKYHVITLPVLLELKLASGMTAPHRMQDITDVMRLIHTAKIPRTLADELNPYVRPKFIELWEIAQHQDDDY